MLEAIEKRRSVRQFADKEVEKEKIMELLKAAMAAPSACDDRQWEFYVVTDPERKEKLSQVTPYTRPAAAAPAVIVLAYQSDAGNAPEYAQINASLAAENMMLEAADQGLGGVLLGIAPHEDRMVKVKELLALPENQEAYAIYAFGYPKKQPAVRGLFEEEKVHWL